MNSKLAIGDTAPDFRFATPWSREINLYDDAGNHPVILIFLRYYGCPVCQMEMANMKREIDLVRQKGARLFVALQSEPETIASLIRKDDFPFTIICDPQGKVFQRYGVEAGGMIRYLHPAGLAAAIKAMARGFRHGEFEGRETQLPAAFAIAADRLITYARYGKNISDTPPLSELTSCI